MATFSFRPQSVNQTTLRTLPLMDPIVKPHIRHNVDQINEWVT